MARFACGPTATYDLPIPESDECVVEVAANPSGDCLAVLTQRHLHLWVCARDLAHMGFVPLPLTPGVSGDEDVATHLLWHPCGEKLVVSTQHRRLLFYEFGISTLVTDILSPAHYDHTLCLPSAAQRVRFVGAERLEAGLVTTLTCSGLTTFFACTTAGAVCVVGWLQQRLLHTWTCHALSRAPHTLTSCDGGGNAFVGTIVDTHHSVSLRLTAFLLSDGVVLLVRSNVGNDFTRDNVTFTGRCAPATLAVRVAMNARHMLLAMATPGGDALCSRISDELTLTPRWNGLKCLRDSRRAGPVSNLHWSPDEESLAIGFYHMGFVVVHHSGFCVFASLFPSPSSSSTLSTPASGCVNLCWGANNHRLFAATPDAISFVVVEFHTLTATPSVDRRGAFTPLLSFGTNDVRLAGCSPLDGALSLRDVVLPAYLSEQWPISYAAICGDGSAIVVAGRRGFAIFDRLTRRWRTLRSQREERDMKSVVTPAWIGRAVLILGVQRIAARSYALLVYANTHLDAAALLANAPLEHRPVLLSTCTSNDNIHNVNKNTNYVALVDNSDTLLLWCCTLELLPKQRAGLLLICRITLPALLRSPVALKAVNLSYPDTMLPLLLLVDSRTHSLVAIDPTEGNKTKYSHVSCGEGRIEKDKEHTCEVEGGFRTVLLSHGGVYGFWHDASVPLNGAVFLIASDSGIGLLHLTQRFAPGEWYSIAEPDADAMVVGLSAHDGCLLLASVSPTGEDGASVQLKPLLYNYRVLSALTRLGLPRVEPSTTRRHSSGVSAVAPVVWGDRFFDWMERMRGNGTFVPNADYYLYTLIDETPPGGIDQLDRRAAVQAAVALLRRYAEFYSIVVGCVRKMDLSRWQVVLDVIGSPLELFRECVENQRLEEAARLLRVIMLSASTQDGEVAPLGSALACTAHLMTVALQHRNVSLVSDLVRFAALLHTEMSPTVVPSVDIENESMWTRLLRVVGLQQTTPQVMEDQQATQQDQHRQSEDEGRRRELRTLSNSITAHVDPMVLLLPIPIHVPDSTSAYLPPLATSTTSSSVTNDTVTGATTVLSVANPITTTTTTTTVTATGDEVNFPNMDAFGTSITADMGERRRGIEFLMQHYPNVRYAVHEVLLSELFSGHFIFLQSMLRELCICLPHLVTAVVHDNSESEKAIRTHFCAVFDGIHEEFDLPRGQRPIGEDLQRFLTLPVTEWEEEGERDLCASRALWTQAQSFLYATPGIVDSLLELRKLYAVWTDCVFAINIVLMRTTDVVRQLHRDRSLLDSLQTLVTLPQNVAYSPFVHHCVDASRKISGISESDEQMGAQTADREIEVEPDAEER